MSRRRIEITGGVIMQAAGIKLLNAEEVAEMLGVSERTLWRLLSAGKLPNPIRFGRSTRWKSEDIQGWIDKGCPGGK
jgi:excisionase family DNA binding protein